MVFSYFVRASSFLLLKKYLKTESVEEQTLTPKFVKQQIPTAVLIESVIEHTSVKKLILSAKSVEKQQTIIKSGDFDRSSLFKVIVVVSYIPILCQQQIGSGEKERGLYLRYAGYSCVLVTYC
jgi:hypothetical protein